MTRARILMEACRIVNGDRNKQYGTPEDNFALIADLWSAYLGQEVTNIDVAMMMTMLKIARIKTGRSKEDSFVDACGYVACAGQIATE